MRSTPSSSSLMFWLKLVEFSICGTKLFYIIQAIPTYWINYYICSTQGRNMGKLASRFIVSSIIEHRVLEKMSTK